MAIVIQDVADATGESASHVGLVTCLRAWVARDGSGSLLVLFDRGRGPSSLPGLNGLILAFQSTLHTTVTLRPFLVALFLLLLAAERVRLHERDGRGFAGNAYQ